MGGHWRAPLLLAAQAVLYQEPPGSSMAVLGWVGEIVPKIALWPHAFKARATTLCALSQDPELGET